MLRPLLHLEYENRLFSGSVGTLYIERSFFDEKKTKLYSSIGSDGLPYCTGDYIY